MRTSRDDDRATRAPRTVHEACDRLRQVLHDRARRVSADADLEPFEEPCRVMSSPGGRWVLAPTKAEAMRYRLAHPGEAVFLADEVRRVGDGLADATGDIRQAWLADVIAAKGAIPGATVEWVRRIPPGKQGGSSRRK